MRPKMTRLCAALAGALLLLPIGSQAQSRPDLHRRALTHSGYIGGEKLIRSSISWLDDVAVDDDYSTVFVGSTRAADLPVKNAYQPEPGGSMDAYLIKINQDDEIVFATYLGWDETDYGQDVAIDPAGNIYVTGWTFGAFPDTTATPRPPCQYETQASYVAKFSPRGELVYSKCIDAERAYAVAGNAEGAAYVVGDTTPTAPGTSLGAGGGYDIFVYKLDPTGTTYEYRTFVGGPGVQGAFELEIDETGAAYVVGSTTSEAFPLVNPADSTKEGNTDGVIFKLASDGQSLEFSTYVGNRGNEDVNDLAIGDSGSVYAVGDDTPRDYDNPRAEAFYVHLSSDGSEFLERSSVSGNDTVKGSALALAADDVYISGWTTASDLPDRGGFQARKGGASDGYIAQIDRTSGTVVATTYFGGSEGDSVSGLALDPGGDLVGVGSTSSSDLAVANAFQSRLRGKGDGFFFRLTITGGSCTILGGGSHDKLFGSVGGDLICSGPGDDRVLGRDGNDEIVGGKGDDVLRGSGGRDVIEGGPGRDRCAGEKERRCET